MVEEDEGHDIAVQIAIKTKKGTMVYYQADENHPVFNEVRSLVAKGA